jgi:hypothetical protein
MELPKVDFVKEDTWGNGFKVNWKQVIKLKKVDKNIKYP